MTQTWEERRTKDIAERIADIRSLAAAGFCVNGVAKKVGASVSGVDNFLERAGAHVVFPRLAYRYSDAQTARRREKLERRVALSNERPQLTVEQAAAREGVTAKTMQKYSSANNLAWKPRQNWI